MGAAIATPSSAPLPQSITIPSASRERRNAARGCSQRRTRDGHLRFAAHCSRQNKIGPHVGAARNHKATVRMPQTVPTKWSAQPRIDLVIRIRVTPTRSCNDRSVCKTSGCAETMAACALPELGFRGIQPSAGEQDARTPPSCGAVAARHHGRREMMRAGHDVGNHFGFLAG